MKRFISSLILCFFLLNSIAVYAEPQVQPNLSLKGKSGLLMESSSGKVLYANNENEHLPLASVTKVMTMLLICEAIDGKRLSLDDKVTVSKRAKDMGGSTIFLETNEQMSVRDMLKGIAVSSGNDACVAMAEHIAGSEEAFVELMNKRAGELGMKNTHFVNSNGFDNDNHYSSAYDIALMSRELIKHKMIFDYTTIWMDTLRDGKFQMSNTNKLIRFYSGANGLKTGSTSKARNCISATAERDGMLLIAVVVGAQTSAERFEDAKKMLDYGFATYRVVTGVEKGESLGMIPVQKGSKKKIEAITGDGFKALSKKGGKEKIERVMNLESIISAPIKKGQKIGVLNLVSDNKTVVGSVDIIANDNVDKLNLLTMYHNILSVWIKGKV